MMVLSVFLAIAACAAADARDIQPIAVWSPTPTQPAGQATLNRLIDGDWNTVCCFLDDTPTGKDLKATPPNGDQPITARFVLDLGNPQEVSGIRFVAQKSWANYMAENVTVFACDDREGKVNVRLLQDQCHLPPINSLNAAFVTWKPITARYIGVQVNDSFGRSHGGLDWWRGANPQLSQEEWRCNEKLKYNFGWNWGAMLAIIRTLPQVAGGPLYDAGAAQNQFLTQIAEVSCFCGRPADMPSPNTPEVAFPEHRLERDWMYQDCGVKNASMVANSTDASKPDPIGPDISPCFSSRESSVLEWAMVERALAELKQDGVDVAPLERRRTALSSAPGKDARWKSLYFDACRQRRRERLKTVRQWAAQFIYVKHFVFGCWTFVVPSDDVSDEQLFERSHDFHEGSQLCLATIHEDGSVTNEVLLEKPRGVIRDPNLSFDAKTLVFSMRDNFKTDDYHLYTMDMPSRKVWQITFSPIVGGKILPCSDTAPCFIPSGDLVFQSTRCAQMDVCWAHPTSNLYTCDVEGRYVRRLAFDQVGTMAPQTLEDGRVIYTRWEYMDRNPFYLQSLFVMNADGTGQTALYGNNSIYPAALLHARGIPNTEKIITVVSGHHVLQKGKLAIIGRSRGSEGDGGIEYVAGASPDGRPGRHPSNIHPPVDRLNQSGSTPYDFFGQIGPQWQYPYAFDDDHYLTAFVPEGCFFLKGPFNPPFGVYYMTADGRRELLAFDWGNSCGQAIPVMATKRPPVKPSSVDWTKPWGDFYVQNVYAGPGLEGVKKGTVKRLRVVGLEYRAAGISKNYNCGFGVSSHINTPIAIDNGSQDVKHVLGEVDVEEDGSVYFEVPARTAVYFQMLDAKGRCVQTMRSWTMVLPGERVGCVGCHENKLQAGLTAGAMPLALRRRAQKLQPLPGQPPHPLLTRLKNTGPLEDVDAFLGVNRPCSIDPQSRTDGFSYTQLVQPIWDKHCVRCHQGDTNDRETTKRSALRLTGEIFPSPPGKELNGLRKFTQSYLALVARGQWTPLGKWVRGEMTASISHVLQATKAHGEPLLTWVHPASLPAMLPPYSCGSSQSKFMDYLESSHYDVRLTDAEKRTVACWIDLAVPFCGSYGQANAWDRLEWRSFIQIESNTWNKPQKELYDYFQRKRVAFAEQEMENIKALLKASGK
jgi:hypothetical protein